MIRTESGLFIVDISDISNPVLAVSYPMDSPYGLGIKDEKLFVCDGESGTSQLARFGTGWNLFGLSTNTVIRIPEDLPSIGIDDPQTIKGPIWYWDSGSQGFSQLGESALPLHRRDQLFPGRGYMIYLGR